MTRPLMVDAEIFRPGMESGIYKHWVEGREPWDSYEAEDPYIMINYRKVFLRYGDWIVTYPKGRKEVMTDSEFNNKFKKITDEVDRKLSSIFDLSEK
ncbi:MAG: hypothetical protein PHN69_07310 [Candidatus Pacebacteria bacterium]|nr:hypothetical protein [Fermentimonas sp.]MDD4804932.1 hypothetical protein [Candidatus Paceibacterota bacterium]